MIEMQQLIYVICYGEDNDISEVAHAIIKKFYLETFLGTKNRKWH